ncbi:MAG TPA: di-heme oxidoredictase family protein [Phycisphaerales bacterium]|nr:di-heme oxidoredictase family protein [Phycisphaerales bacterium]|tara:strand:- start:2701 stop:4365 length:1665 start_codon:yes stop_codon:yes gene_type:complete
MFNNQRTLRALCLIGFSSTALATSPQERPGEPLATLTADLLSRFEIGKIAFNEDLTIEGGLGPIFNQTSCGSCHNNPIGGAGSQTVTRFGFIGKKGGFDPLAELGGSLRQAEAINDDCAEFVPPEANVTSLRVTNSALAFGLVEAISDADLLANRDSQPETLRGHAHMVSNFEDPTDELHVGRFGWKAQVASVLTFSSDASQNEMGLSNRFLPFDNAPNGDEELLANCDTVADPEDGPDADGYDFIDRVTDFQRFLAPPSQTPQMGMQGETVFINIGCAVCHTPTFTTGNDPETESVLRNVSIQPYGDFLLHDMGIAGDGIVQGEANGQQLKTPPLWGVAYRDPLWHDARFSAGTFDSRIRDAIAEHGVFGSQGEPSAEAFAALGVDDQNALISFLGSLGQVEFDSDSDGDVERNDFHGYSDTIGFHPCFGTTVTPDDPCAIHDVDQDGDIDLDDFEVFLIAYDDEFADCNENGTNDLLDILLGETDDDNNGVPDSCQTCLGDLDGDGNLGVSEILTMIDAWGPCMNCASDINGDGEVDVTDLLFIVGNWGPCS